MKKTVLIVDDEPNARAGLRNVLREMGCAVLEAANGTEGIALFRNNNIDLVLTDLRMPGAGGMSVLESIRKENPAIPVVLITAYGTGEAARDALQKGAYDFISKPFKQELLISKMMEQLYKKQKTKKPAKRLPAERR